MLDQKLKQRAIAARNAKITDLDCHLLRQIDNMVSCVSVKRLEKHVAIFSSDNVKLLSSGLASLMNLKKIIERQAFLGKSYTINVKEAGQLARAAATAKDLALYSCRRFDTMLVIAELIETCLTNIETNHQPVQEVI